MKDGVHNGSDPSQERPPDVATASDDELLALMRYGENPERARAAWAEFYSRHVGFLHGVCVRAYATRLRDEVQDLVAQTFRRVFTHGARTYRAADSGDAESRLRRLQGWLTTIAEGLARDMLRGPRRPGIQIEQEEWQEVPEHSGEPVSETTAEVRRLMQSILTDREEDVLRTTFHWYDPTKEHQKLPEEVLAELARRWNTTPDNIRQIRSRALRKLKDALGSVAARPSSER